MNYTKKKKKKGGDGGKGVAASVSGNIKQTLVEHGKALTDEVMQKTSSNKAQKSTSRDHLNVKCVVGEIDVLGGAV